MENINQKNPVTFGDCAYLAIAKHTKKFQKYEQKVLKDENPEDLHQMRVGMRRLRSAMTGFALGLKLPENASQKKVGKIARILGELRDLDVLLDALNQEYLPNLPKREKKQLIEVITKLQTKRVKVFQKVKQCLESNTYQNLNISLTEWLKNPQYQKIATIEIHYVLPDLLLPQISNLLLHKAWLIGKIFDNHTSEFVDDLNNKDLQLILSTEGKELHDLRKEAKKTRYQMELFSQFYGEEYQECLKNISLIQTVLGEIRDFEVLTEHFKDILDLNIKNNLPSLNELLQKKLSSQWAKWQELQAQFLNDGYRKEIREIILKYIPNGEN